MLRQSSWISRLKFQQVTVVIKLITQEIFSCISLMLMITRINVVSTVLTACLYRLSCLCTQLCYYFLLYSYTTLLAYKLHLLSPWLTITLWPLFAYQWYALPPIPGAWWEIGGELTCPNEVSPHTWGTILRTILLHIPYKYPISPCCGQCVTARYGWLDGTILTKHPPLGEDSNGNPPPSFLQDLPQVCQVGHTIDRCIKLDSHSCAR